MPEMVLQLRVTIVVSSAAAMAEQSIVTAVLPRNAERADLIRGRTI